MRRAVAQTPPHVFPDVEEGEDDAEVQLLSSVASRATTTTTPPTTPVRNRGANVRAWQCPPTPPGATGASHRQTHRRPAPAAADAGADVDVDAPSGRGK